MKKISNENDLRDSTLSKTKSKQSLAQKLRREMQTSRNQGEYYQNKGQTERTEEVLR
jgi:hypothetical protein